MHCRDGCANRFVLHLSLQAVSGRIFVQGLEVRSCSEAPVVQGSS